MLYYVLNYTESVHATYLALQSLLVWLMKITGKDYYGTFEQNSHWEKDFAHETEFSYLFSSALDSTKM